MTRRVRRALALAFVAGCAGGLPPTTGVPAVAPADEAELLTGAMHGAREEITRSTEGRQLAYGIFLDTLVGPTPDGYYYAWAHRPEWLEAMVATKLATGLFGIGGPRRGAGGTIVAVQIGAPYPAGRDTFEVRYDWCFRPYPAEHGTSGKASSWRDAFVRSDTGWTRVRHAPTVILSACSL